MIIFLSILAVCTSVIAFALIIGRSIIMSASALAASIEKVKLTTEIVSHKVMGNVTGSRLSATQKFDELNNSTVEDCALKVAGSHITVSGSSFVSEVAKGEPRV